MNEKPAAEADSWETNEIVDNIINGHGPSVFASSVSGLKDEIIEHIFSGVPENSIAHTFLWESVKQVDWDAVYHYVMGDPDPDEDDSDEDEDEVVVAHQRTVDLWYKGSVEIQLPLPDEVRTEADVNDWIDDMIASGTLPEPWNSQPYDYWSASGDDVIFPQDDEP